jgi:CheY-like chemotaxis protein
VSPDNPESGSKRRDAMPDGGRLTIETHNVCLDRDYVDAVGNLERGQYVLIDVSDTGCGMDANTLAHAFEPFFTTKEVGQGTGLGLSQVYGFLKQSHGHVKLSSEPGQATSVKMYLPRLIGVRTEDVEPNAPVVARKTGTETILVVEDDPDVRTFSVEVLRELGYRVLEAGNGPTAVDLLQQQADPIDLLFSDVVLPGGMNGAVLASQARAMRPQLKVLYTTGYARDAIVHDGRLDQGVELIAKPFTYDDLSSRVREVLDQPQRG